MLGVVTMSQSEIIFRKAKIEDVPQIWELLHAASQMKDEQSIQENLEQLFVLTQGKRILGVLCGITKSGAATVNWIVIHPLLAESVISKIMILEYQNIFCSNYLFDDSSAQLSEQSLLKQQLLRSVP